MDLISKYFSFRASCLTTIVKILTTAPQAILAVLLSGCGMVGNFHTESCNSHAYVAEDLADYISRRFHSESPVRLAIIPFSVPANLTASNPSTPDVPYILATKIHAGLLANQSVPIVEILDRIDWPGKREEFFKGNYGAINQARAAGYDLVMVGVVDWEKSIDTLVAHVKVIDPELGITVWYGKSVAQSRKPLGDALNIRFGFSLERPDLMNLDSIVSTLGDCILAAISPPVEFEVESEGVGMPMPSQAKQKAPVG